ncbi:hypothetical protein [Aliiglaciecola litoralis]|uniref:Lipoprotein n=1 Tax=Aliiglaciecola litoralis TaxID=582857 RepID=A0ABN1LCA3_9ALTE
MNKRALLFGLSVGLSGCGGSNNSSSPSPTPQQPVPPPVTVDTPEPIADTTFFAVYGQTEARTGEAVGLALRANPGQRVKQIAWQQTAGPSVTIMAPHMQVIGFDTLDAGDYSFLVTGTMSNGQDFEQAIALSVIQHHADIANIRLDHAASEQANVSLRIDSPSSKSISAWRWEQIAGTVNVTLDPQQSQVFFDAPSVNKDEIVVIQGTIEFEDGTTATDISHIVIKDVEINADGFFPRYSEQVVSTDLFSYRKDSPYANALERCVYNNTIDNSCSFNQLPLIGQDNLAPSTADIMQRVLVSHPWMGERFEQFLQRSTTGEDMRKLLRATTAIVISYDIRPSFYWSATGAIYLDAANFWVTPQERDTLNSAPDYRADFGNDLQFSIPWRYIKDNDYYIKSSKYPKSDRLTKSFEDMEASVSWLMYHELAHANDFYPQRSWANVSGTDTPLSYANNNEPSSTAFSQSYPLTSQVMQRLARVSFLGDSASELQKSYTAQQVVDFFEPDKAPAYYSYSTIREDYATLFERFMMLYRLDALADTAIIERDQDNIYPVAWGQRNRVNHPSIQLRTQAVIEQILPEIDVQTEQQRLPGVQLFEPGVGYFEQLNLDPQGSAQRMQKKPMLTERSIEQDLRHHHIGRPITPQH